MYKQIFIFLFFLNSFTFAKEKEFTVKIALKGGHLSEVFFGCAKDASDKYDRKKDDMAPPPGINTGYSAFVSPDNKFYLYKDIRGFKKTIRWNFYGKPFEHKPIKLTWKKEDLPKDYQCKLFFSDNNFLDMKKKTSYIIKDTKILSIQFTQTKK